MGFPSERCCVLKDAPLVVTLVVDVVLLFIALNCSVVWDRCCCCCCCCKPDFSPFGSDSCSTFRLSHSFEFIPFSLTSSKGSLLIAIVLPVTLALAAVVVVADAALAIVMFDMLAGALHFAGRLTLYDNVCNFASLLFDDTKSVMSAFALKSKSCVEWCWRCCWCCCCFMCSI